MPSTSNQVFEMVKPVAMVQEIQEPNSLESVTMLSTEDAVQQALLESHVIEETVEEVM